VGISRIRLLLSLCLGIVAVSFASILIRFAQGAGMPSLSIAAWRLTLASLIVVPYALATRREEIRDLSRWEWGLVGAAGVFLGLHFATWIASLGLTSVASSVVLASMGPVFVGLGSWLFLRERPSLLLAAGILLAAAGSMVISWGDFSQDQLLGDLLALTGAIRARGFILVGPYVPDMDQLISSIEPDAVGVLRGYVIVGEEDEVCYEISLSLAEILSAHGIPCELEIHPGLAHEHPPGFEMSLARALEFILKD